MRADPPAYLVYEAGPLRIDPARRLVTDAESGRLPLAPQMFMTLLLIVKTWPEVVSARSLIRDVLGEDRPYGDTHLAQLVFRLRQLLPRDEYGRPLIAAIHGFGYTVNVPVRTVARPWPCPSPCPCSCPWP